jgi:hypothetical protein
MSSYEAGADDSDPTAGQEGFGRPDPVSRTDLAGFPLPCRGHNIAPRCSLRRRVIMIDRTIVTVQPVRREYRLVALHTRW